MTKKNSITLANGNRAIVVTAPRDANPKAIIDALEITSPRAVILLFGGAAGLDESRKSHLANLFVEGVIPVAAKMGVLIVDGGTQSGVMAIMGQAVARSRAAVQLLGIAPKGKITNPEIAGASTISEGAPLEPNHSHFLLVESNKWGGETTKMLELARAFNVSTVAILVNGGAIAADEALQSVRTGWQVIVIEGSGRFADELSVAARTAMLATSSTIKEITRSGRVKLFSIDESPSKLKRQLQQILRTG